MIGIFWSELINAARRNKPQQIYIPSRAEVLRQLGISKEQDEENQIDWNWKFIEDNWQPKDFDGFK